MPTQVRGDVDIKAGTIKNAQIAAAAGIVYSKLALTGAVVNADIVSLAWSKLTGTPTTLSGYGITSPLPVGEGGTGATAFTAGSVVFAGASGVYTQDNANLFFDNTNNRLGIGTAAPVDTLGVVGNAMIGNVAVGGKLGVYQGSGNPIATFQHNGATDGQSGLFVTTGTAVTGAYYPVSASVNCTGRAFFAIQQNGNGQAVFDALVTGTGDALARFGVNGGQVWSCGLDNSDADKFKVSSSANLGTNDYLTITAAGLVGLGVTAPTAVLHLQAGTATANTAPLKFTAGTNLTTPELGAMEFVDNGTTGHLYITLNVAGVVTRVQIV